MRRLVLRFAAFAGAALVLLGAMAYGLIFRNFQGLAPMPPDEPLPSGAIRVIDAQAGFTTSYLVPAGAGAMVLVDCGVDPSAAAILAALEQRGLGPEAVKAVLLTHGHSDHLGGCGAFQAAPIMALEAERGLVEGTAPAHSPMGTLAGIQTTGLSLGRALVDGEEVMIGEARVKVFALPGHTAGSAAYLVGGGLYVGDSLGVDAARAIRPAVWIFSEDTALNRRGLAALPRRISAAGLKVEKIIPAHSGTADGLAALEAFTE